MNKYKVAFSIATVITLSACTNTNDPQLAMCQAVTKQLTGNSVASWDGDSKQNNLQRMVVSVKYTNANGQVGTTDCLYPKDDQGKIATAPQTVSMNNQRVDQQVLLKAGTQASKELLTGTYKNTVEKTTELAEQAAEKGTELAGQAAAKGKELAGDAKEAAIEGAKALQQLQQNSQ